MEARPVDMAMDPSFEVSGAVPPTHEVRPSTLTSGQLTGRWTIPYRLPVLLPREVPGFACALSRDSPAGRGIFDADVVRGEHQPIRCL